MVELECLRTPDFSHAKLSSTEHATVWHSETHNEKKALPRPYAEERCQINLPDFREEEKRDLHTRAWQLETDKKRGVCSSHHAVS
jgi:hypothetical protein